MSTIATPLEGHGDAPGLHWPPAAEALLAQLELLPDWLAWTPIGRKKNAYLKGWADNPKSKAEIRAEITEGRCHAVGLICGPASGLLVLDHDGASAAPLLEELMTGEQRPQTWCWTSGRKGRWAEAYRVPETYWPELVGKWEKRTDIKSPDDGKMEGLEIRWKGHQSVVIGAHPTTAGYRWFQGRSPAELPQPAEAPLPLITMLLKRQPEAGALALPEPQALLANSLRLPLLEFTAKETRVFIETGGTPGQWNDEQLKYTLDLISSDQWINQQGHIAEPTARDAFANHIVAARQQDSCFDERKAWQRFEGGLKRNACPSTPLERLQDRLDYHMHRAANQKAGTIPKQDASKKRKSHQEKPIPDSFQDLIKSAPPGWSLGKDGDRKPSTLSAGRLSEEDMLPPERLRYNELLLLPEVRTGKGWLPINDSDMDSAYVILSRKGWIIGVDSIAKAVYHVARLQTFHPVQNYLLGLEKNENIKAYDLDQVAPRFFRATKPMHVAMVRKWLIGAVARALQPGCQMDYALVLQSDKQGLGKSTTLKALAGPDWFNSTVPDADKDFLLAVHSCWIFELAEIEHVTGGRAEGRLKNLISTSTDLVRLPYGRTTQRMPRSSVFVGTVNAREFLRDATGNRRYWVVPIEGDQELDRDAIVASRDAIWKAAVIAWRSGELPMLDRKMATESETQNDQFVTEDPWLAMLQAWIDGNPLSAYGDSEQKHRLCAADPSQPFSTAEALYAAGLRRLDQCGRSEENRIAPLLRQLGFEKGSQVRRHGQRVRLWSRSAVHASSQASQPVSTLKQEGCDIQDQLQRNDSDELSQLSQPISIEELEIREQGRPQEVEEGVEGKQVVTVESPTGSSLQTAAGTEESGLQHAVTSSEGQVVSEPQVVTTLATLKIAQNRIPCLVNGEGGWFRKAGPIPHLSVFVLHEDGRQLSAGRDQIRDLPLAP